MAQRDERWYNVLVKHAVPIKLLKNLRRAPLVNESTITTASSANSAHDIVPRELTHNEKLVVFCMAEGMTREETAEALNKSVETIKSQLLSARHKLEAKNTHQLIARAIRWNQII